MKIWSGLKIQLVADLRFETRLRWNYGLGARIQPSKTGFNSSAIARSRPFRLMVIGV